MNRIVIAIAALCAALFAAAGCDNPAEGPAGVPAGRAVISIGGEGRARTVSPSDDALEGFAYELSFSGPEGASHNLETISYGGAKTVSLEPGEWTVTARGKDEGGVKAEGSWTGAVRSGGDSEAFITLTPKPGSGSGTFTYTIEVPDAAGFPGVWAGWSTFLDLYEVKRDGTEAAVPGMAASAFTPGKPYTVSLPAGFYRANAGLSDGGRNAAVITAAAHIYAGLDAAAGFRVSAADFAPVKSLLSIEVTSPPLKTAYAVGESLNTAGMAVTASYSDGTAAAVSGWTVSGFDSSTAGSRTLTVSYTEGGVTKTAAFTVTVNAAAKVLSSIEVTSPPLKTAYAVGESLNTAGMAVTASYSDGTAAAVSGWTVSGFNSGSAGTKSVTVSYTEGGVTRTAAFQVTVNPAAPAPADMAYIPGGTFMMGSPASEPDRYSDETQHQVTVSPFYMSRYEVTQAEYRAVMGTNPSYFTGGDNLPVESVTWYDAVAYCNARSAMEGLAPAYVINGSDVSWDRAANGYRLPTEAEWEYACRAGTTTPFNTGDNITTDQANYDGNYPYNGNPAGVYRGRTTAAGTFAPNAWGLYDMHGNVWEWCWDWYGSYTSGSQTDPAGPPSGGDRVIRGGSWINLGGLIRSANRDYGYPSDRIDDVGFRPVRLSSGG